MKMYTATIALAVLTSTASAADLPTNKVSISSGELISVANIGLRLVRSDDEFFKEDGQMFLFHNNQKVQVVIITDNVRDLVAKYTKDMY